VTVDELHVRQGRLEIDVGRRPDRRRAERRTFEYRITHEAVASDNQRHVKYLPEEE
jgi:hypothetical protein